ncbi:carotenoid oxygenase [Cryphonectria parasitica EP155]|uniref:Carotenoid oxygenase n=1 Tax=Cryphonectria parasitica (strain ATCC 38755 / EP155) TaxID=660469 RepID=A0A9P4XS03_CRYP1|nr:carotenoid oxygenase [Cryphonectria parasitica EP155]KAF3759923.1 carotenoid oxygenase [Cryphonectria parasitica EP155]
MALLAENEPQYDAPKHRHPYLSGNFAPVQKTTPLTPCTYTGSIPHDLGGGQYVRNGGNPVTNDDLGRDAHWFDGDGMLSGVLFHRTGEKGTLIQPEFVNQFLVTDVYAYAKRSSGNRRDACATSDGTLRRPVLPSIATLVNPCAGIFTIIWSVLRTIILVMLSHLYRARYPIKKISVANTSVIFHDGRALALCESGPPLRFVLPSLETIGWFNGQSAENEPSHQLSASRGGFGGQGLLSFMKEWTTAHPRVDPITKEMIAFHSVFIRPFCYYSIVPPSSVSAKSGAPSMGSARFSMPVPGVKAPKMMHDFGASRNHTVILDLPLTLDPANLARGVPVLSYDSAGVSRFGVFPRYSPDRIQWFETNPCVIFHTANCWDTTTKMLDINGAQLEKTSVHLLACRLTSASLVFSAGNLPTPAVKPVPPEYAEEEQCRLYYYNFPLSPDNLSDEPEHRTRHQWALSAISFEFPTMSPDHSMASARYIYGCSTADASYTVALGKAAKINHLAKIDVQTLIDRGVRQPPQPIKGCVDTRTVAEILAANDPDDPIKLFRMPEGWYAQEARFVPRRESERKSEDDGWLLTYVFDESQLETTGDHAGECHDDAVSELWIIDARTMKEVVARIRLPQRVPYGLHGAWFSEDEIRDQRPFQGLRTLDYNRGRSW